MKSSMITLSLLMSFMSHLSWAKSLNCYQDHINLSLTYLEGDDYDITLILDLGTSILEFDGIYMEELRKGSVYLLDTDTASDTVIIQEILSSFPPTCGRGSCLPNFEYELTLNVDNEETVFTCY